MPLEDIAAHMRTCYPAEGCGLVFEDAAGALTFCPIPNIAGSTDLSTRTQRDGYVMDPKAQFLAIDGAERAGGRLYAIAHSHPDVGAYFSKEDRARALDDGGEPLWPGVQYLVVSVRNGAVDGIRRYIWQLERRDFIEEIMI
ncbi:MAG: M67 family metallopeptidase [Myxococcales bacterium]|nr:M67 family metallopeptidase [Myxococcales bacterium]